MSSNGEESILRVSVAILNRVLFSHPKNGTSMLAMERKGAVREDGSVHVWAQPFGGAVRILDPAPLEAVVGELRFDSKRSEQEQDLRIVIAPSKWEALKNYCRQTLSDLANVALESYPHRELTEEFNEALGVELEVGQYTARPLGFVAEDHPTPTGNSRANGYPTVRLYRLFEVQIVDKALCEMMLDGSESSSEEVLAVLAQQDHQNGSKGSVHSILTLPLQAVTTAWLALPLGMRYRSIRVDGHELDESVLAVLEDIEVPQYERV